MRIPSDLRIIGAIYSRYYAAFAAFSRESPSRATKIYVPIDIAAIARGLGVDSDIVFGRLYYHLDRKFGYQHPDGTSVHFFTLVAGADRHCVNFPLLASVLAALREDRARHLWTLWLAILSFVISAVSMTVALLRHA